jgi:glycosyltransferase involved in cell wall biosynthesis
MKILFYCGGFAPLGGIETFCKNLLCYLQSKDYDCRLVCWGQKSPLLDAIKQAKVKIIHSPWRWGCQWHIPDWLLLPLGLQQIKQADVIILNKLFPIGILKILKLQASNHTKFIYITAYRPAEIFHDSEIIKIIEALSFFDLILVQSSIFIDDLYKIGYQGKIESLPLIPHKPLLPRPFPPLQELKIGFLGRLVEDKNIPLLLNTFSKLQKKYFQFYESKIQQQQTLSLHLFGDGHLREQLEQIAEDLGIKSSVIFYGNIPNDEVETAIASCHIFAFTSRREGQCLAALEILGGGRPIVATAVGAFPEILSDSRLGRIVESTNPSDFAEALMKMAKLVELNAVCPETIYSAYLERYDPEKVAENYENILSNLCKQ